MAGISLFVLKVGGSLFDLPGLGERLRRLVGQLGEARVVFFPGGGAAADLLRAWDKIHHLGEEASHWLALRALALHAQLLRQLLPGARIVSQSQQLSPAPAWHIVDPLAWAQRDEENPGRLPHTWEVTSDSLALRLAQCWGAAELILLKSVHFPRGLSWQEGAREGLVDAFFPRLLAEKLLPVRWVNLREEGPLVG